jgi:superfamily II DNA or RNA helicase
MISIDTARALLDFAGGGDSSPARISQAQAEAQLEGAVAIHNILEQHRVAYLADEVGMGKTYVALGALALFRHFDPKFRLLVIAPKENIQQKWTKELRNFVRNNVRFADCRIKAIHQAPAKSPVLCDNLVSLVRETTLDPDRDFFARLSSFSFGLGDDITAWKKKRDALLRAVPWLDEGLLDLRSKEVFKENFARAVCCALPSFDLLIIDEAHNLNGAARHRGSCR